MIDHDLTLKYANIGLTIIVYFGAITFIATQLVTFGAIIRSGIRWIKWYRK